MDSNKKINKKKRFSFFSEFIGAFVCKKPLENELFDEIRISIYSIDYIDSSTDKKNMRNDLYCLNHDFNKAKKEAFIKFEI